MRKILCSLAVALSLLGMQASSYLWADDETPPDLPAPTTRPLAQLSTKAAAIALSADGTRAIATDAASMAYVWEMPTGRELHRIRLSGQPSGGQLVISDNGKRAVLVAGAEPNRSGTALSFLDLGTGKETAYVESDKDKDWVDDIAMSPDGAQVLSAVRDNGIVVWDAVKATPVGKIPVSGAWAQLGPRAFSSDGQSAAFTDYSYDEGNTTSPLYVWNFKTGKKVAVVKEVPYAYFDDEQLRVVKGITLLTNAKTPGLYEGGKILSAVTGDVLFWDVQTGKLIRQLEVAEFTRQYFTVTGEGPAFDNMVFALSPDSQLAVTADDCGHILLWDYKGAKPIGKRELWSSGRRDIACVFDGKQILVLSSGDKGVELAIIQLAKTK